MTGFAVTGQDDFRGGLFQAPSPEQIPANGSYDIINGLLDQDTGTVYRRGGAAYLLNAAATTSPMALWDGYLLPGRYTVVTGNNYIGALDTGGTAWVTLSSSVDTPYGPPVAVGGFLIFPMDTASGYGAYAGSYDSSAYSTGTISIANNTTTVAGTGTAWVGQLDPGSILVASGGTQWGIVRSVIDNTHIELYEPWTTGSIAAGTGYTVMDVYTAPTPPSLQAQAATPALPMYAAAVGSPTRLVLAAGNRVAFSDPGNPSVFASTDFHELPQGVRITGLASLRDTCFVFTTEGVWAIRNMNFDLTDAFGNPQQRLDQIAKTLRLWSPFGITGWEDGLVIPGVDGVYLMSESGSMRPISAPIDTLYRFYSEAGLLIGDAEVHRDHYFLPVVRKPYSGRSIVANQFYVVDMLVCHLPTGAWTRWADLSGGVAALTVRLSDPARTPKLLGYTKHTALDPTALLDLTGCFSPATANNAEPDGTVHQFSWTTRDYATGSNKSNLVKKARLRFEGTAAAGSPTLTVSVASGPTTAAYTALSTTDGSTVGPSTGTQTVPFSANRADRFVRFKIATTDAWDTLKIKGLELFIRPRGRQ